LLTGAGAHVSGRGWAVDGSPLKMETGPVIRLHGTSSLCSL
jgi:hypothetical protein